MGLVCSAEHIIFHLYGQYPELTLHIQHSYLLWKISRSAQNMLKQYAGHLDSTTHRYIAFAFTTKYTEGN